MKLATDRLDGTEAALDRSTGLLVKAFFDSAE